MPIKGLTDQPRESLPRLGQLRKGGAKTDPKKPGPDLTYFRFVSNSQEIAARFYDLYGKEPREIRVVLPYQTLNENFPTWMEEWGAGSLKHRCDKETMSLWQDGEGVYHTEPLPCPYAEYADGDTRRKCKEHGLLFVIIPELGRWGQLEVTTTSKWDCLEMTNNLRAIGKLAERVSIITGRQVTMQGIPCLLRREPRMTSCPRQGGRVRQEKWLLHLEVDPSYMQLLMRASQTYALPLVDMPQIAAPDLALDYDPGEDAEPETVEAEPVEEVQPEPQPEPAAVPNGRTYGRADFIARIRALEQEADDLGQPIHTDEAVLDEASPEELKRIGRELRARVDALWRQAEQAAMPLDEAA